MVVCLPFHLAVEIDYQYQLDERAYHACEEVGFVSIKSPNLLCQCTHLEGTKVFLDRWYHGQNINYGNIESLALSEQERLPSLAAFSNSRDRDDR